MSKHRDFPACLWLETFRCLDSDDGCALRLTDSFFRSIVDQNAKTLAMPGIDFVALYEHQHREIFDRQAMWRFMQNGGVGTPPPIEIPPTTWKATISHGLKHYHVEGDPEETATFLRAHLEGVCVRQLKLGGHIAKCLPATFDAFVSVRSMTVEAYGRPTQPYQNPTFSWALFPALRSCLEMTLADSVHTPRQPGWNQPPPERFSVIPAAQITDDFLRQSVNHGVEKLLLPKDAAPLVGHYEATCQGIFDFCFETVSTRGARHLSIGFPDLQTDFMDRLVQDALNCKQQAPVLLEVSWQHLTMDTRKYEQFQSPNYAYGEKAVFHIQQNPSLTIWLGHDWLTMRYRHNE